MNNDHVSQTKIVHRGDVSQLAFHLIHDNPLFNYNNSSIKSQAI